MENLVIGATLLASLSIFIHLETNYLQEIAKNQFLAQVQNDAEFTSQEYDFIIVGAGTAGCYVASKLSESYSVLLLEAGGPTVSLTATPGLRPSINSVPGINYAYKTTKQQHLENRVLEIPTGKLVGGSSATNFLAYNRGNRYDYDNWAKITGDKSFRYRNEVQRIFKSLEKYHGPFPSSHRGEHGPIPVTSTNSDILNLFEGVAKELGYNFSDPNGPQGQGLGTVDFTISRNGRAATSCSVLINPLLGQRERLTVLTYASATKVLFRNKASYGVEYERFGRIFRAHAQKEVILSAGTYGSPLLLYKSGIGPRGMLEKAKIDLVADLPVGRFLKDHLRMQLNVTFGRTPPPSVEANLTQRGLDTFLKGRRDGLLSDSLTKVQGFFVSKVAKRMGEADWPDLQILAFVESHTINAVLVRPKSAGRFNLNTKRFRQGERDNVKLAKIKSNYLKHPDDLQSLIEGIRIILRMLDSKILRDARWAANFSNHECLNSGPLNSDDYWTCAIRREVVTIWHPVGTCRMGFGPGDRRATVDPKFSVLKVARLRIVDASVFPEITNANTQAPTLLMAAKAASIILAEYSK